MATRIVELSTTWVELSTGAMLINRGSAASILIQLAESLPTDSIGHNLYDMEPRMFPAPVTGVWYGKVSHGIGTAIVTDV